MTIDRLYHNWIIFAIAFQYIFSIPDVLSPCTRKIDLAPGFLIYFIGFIGVRSRAAKNKGYPGRVSFALVPLTGSIFIFAFAKNYCSHQFLNWWQELSTGQFHCYGFESRSRHKNKGYPNGVSLILAYTTQFDTMQRSGAERCIFSKKEHLRCTCSVANYLCSALRSTGVIKSATAPPIRAVNS